MRSNPLVAEVLTGLTRRGKAQLDYLWLMALQAAVLFVWWPKGSVAELLQSQHGPHTLEAVAMAVGVSIAYFALRAGAEESMLPGQHGLRDWALATPLGLARILRGYVLGQLIHSLHLLALSLTAAADGLHGVRRRMGRARMVHGGGARPGAVLPAVRRDHAPHDRTASRRELLHRARAIACRVRARRLFAPHEPRGAHIPRAR